MKPTVLERLIYRMIPLFNELSKHTKKGKFNLPNGHFTVEFTHPSEEE